MTEPLDLSVLSDKVDISEDGLLKHNLVVLQAIASIAATVGHKFEVELRPHTGLCDAEFIIRGDDNVWVAFTYEEALEFLVEVTSEASREVDHGKKD
jgi:hypothetical protein